MKSKKTWSWAAAPIAMATTLVLAACSGGGGGSSSTTSGSSSTGSSSGSSTTSSQTTTSANVNPSQYAAGSIQASVMTTLNAYRQQCGFPAFIENTTLDQAATNHAAYMVDNSVIVDNETQGLTGFTGVTYDNRATALGYPSNTGYAGVSSATYQSSATTNSGYAANVLASWLGGVYHQQIATTTTQEIGIGVGTGKYAGNGAIYATVSTQNLQSSITNGPLTFPCQGVTGAIYEEASESPTPPNTSGPWGTPMTVQDNPGTTLTLTSGTLTSPTGTVIQLNLLDSANDPNKELLPQVAVAYPTSPLQPNTTYTATLTGTDNGTAFSRTFSFTTGNIEG